MQSRAPASHRRAGSADVRRPRFIGSAVSAAQSEKKKKKKNDEKCTGGHARSLLHKPGLFTFASNMECSVAKLKKQSFRNTFGLLADGHQEREHAGDDHLRVPTESRLSDDFTGKSNHFSIFQVEFAIHS